MSRVLAFALLALVARSVAADSAHAADTPEQACQRGRAQVAAQYAACQHKALARYFKHFDMDDVTAAAGKCRAKYAATWPRLQSKAPGSSCDAPRFSDDGTTVVDNLTGLQWEKKTDDGTLHDKDDSYWWSDAVGPEGNGDLFTIFFATMNGTCFAGQCDWRLPTLAELQTIVPEAAPCTAHPCIDPIFGPTFGSLYWSSTTLATQPNVALGVELDDGEVGTGAKHGIRYFVRAVRGGS